MNFEPQAVDKKSWCYWLKESMALSTRRTTMFVLFTMLIGSLHFLPRALSAVFLVSIPLALGVGTLIAYCSDTSRSFIDELKAKPLVIWLRLIAVGSAPWVLLAVFSAIALLITGHGEPPVFEASHEGTIFEEASMSLMAVMFIWFITMGWLVWFIVPLVVIAEMPVAESIDQTIDALALNRFVYGIIAVAAVSAFLLGAFSPVLVFPWYAIVTSMMYVSFRHIWMARRDNLPKTVAATNSIPALSSNA